MRHRQYDKTELYVRLREERGSRILATYSIGLLLAMRDPQAFVDPQNRLHVLHSLVKRSAKTPWYSGILLASFSANLAIAG